MSRVVDLYYEEDPNDIDEPVGRYERVFDDEVLSVVRRNFRKDSELRELVWAFDTLRELIDENNPYRDKVLVRIGEQLEYKRRFKALHNEPTSKYELMSDASYNSFVLMETFIKKKEYELIYRFISLFEDNTVRLTLDGVEFILHRNEYKRKVLGVGFIWLCDLNLGKGITIGIFPEVDLITNLTVIPMDADL